MALSRSRNSLPVLKNGTNFSSTGTGGAGARVAADARRAMLDREGAEAAQLDPIAARQRLDDLVEDDVDDALDVAMEQMRIGGGDLLDELGLDHLR